MNTVTVEDGVLLVQPHGMDRVLTFTGELRIPLAHVVSAAIEPTASSVPKGLRMPGMHIPGKWTGTYVRDGERTWWNVTGEDRTIVVRLAGEHYARVYASVADPAGVVAQINTARSALS